MKEGKIEFITLFEGSKSEHVGPVLVTEDGSRIKLYLNGDNPFENTGLRPYDGRNVRLTGEFKGNQTFVIDGIEETPAPDVSEAAADTGDESLPEEEN